MRKSNYDKKPATPLQAPLWKGWEAILSKINEVYELSAKREAFVVIVECYQGIYHPELMEKLSLLPYTLFIDTQRLFKSPDEIENMTRPYMTDDRIFGFRSSFSITDFLDEAKVASCLEELNVAKGLVVIYGHGASQIHPEADCVVYADMARWEIQQRSRRKEINGLGVDNKEEAPSIHYKRGYFIDWIVCDKLKKQLLLKADFWLDTHERGNPKMITGEALRKGLHQTARRPFRVVPFFDPAPWGGQWMKKVCDLDRESENYGWCFDCVPEENSLYFDVSGTLFEMPANNMVFYQTRELLGEPVEARFGQDFPIRFDFLDTMNGGNLSLQVHPTTQYIHDTFGIFYTQDESYYLLDADKDAVVYLGLKDRIDPELMINELQEAQETGKTFDVEKFVNKWPAKKHDHFLIPAGTIHCSGSNAMVLEISATPSIFTFKLWDWARMGLDGHPRPINIHHGAQVIQWERDVEFVQQQLINRIELIAEGEGWREERTGLHKNEFIETRRHWFTEKVHHHTGESVNVLNVIEGDTLVVESPSGAFSPFEVHYAETFIIPACVGEYTIRPADTCKGECCGTIKAYIRFKE